MRKTIAIFSPSLAGGGAERVMINLGKGFVDRGFPVDLVVSSAIGEYKSQLDQRINLVDLRCRRVATSLPRLIRYLRRELPSAMLSTQVHANVVALSAGLLSGVATRFVVRDTFSPIGGALLSMNSYRAYGIQWLASRLYSRAASVVAVCNDLRSEIAETFGLAADRIAVIYNPIAFDDIEAKAKLETDHDWLDAPSMPVVLSIGRLEAQKDFSTLIRAFAIVQSSMNARLVILGEGSLRSPLTELVQSLGLNDRVDMPGFVDNPYAYIARANAFVLSSIFEGLPNALLEALALGTPLVSTDCRTGPREILRNGQDGILVPVGDIAALAEGIRSALTSGTRTSAPSESLQRFEFDHIVDQYLGLLCPEYATREAKVHC